MKKIDTIGERLKSLRKDKLNLTQSEFAIRISLTQNSIAKFETGIRTMSDRTISDICREFNVNEHWFRTGEGEIFAETDESILAQVKKEYNLDDLSLEVVTEFLTLDVADRKVITNFIKGVRKRADTNEPTDNSNLKVLEHREEPTYNIRTVSRSTNDEEMKNIKVSETEFFNLLNELESAPGVTSEKDL